VSAKRLRAAGVFVGATARGIRCLPEQIVKAQALQQPISAGCRPGALTRSDGQRQEPEIRFLQARPPNKGEAKVGLSGAARPTTGEPLESLKAT
jgi:hypothetical protein